MNFASLSLGSYRLFNNIILSVNFKKDSIILLTTYYEAKISTPSLLYESLHKHQALASL